jgi:anti-anti-sigma regulatory factor
MWPLLDASLTLYLRPFEGGRGLLSTAYFQEEPLTMLYRPRSIVQKYCLSAGLDLFDPGAIRSVRATCRRIAESRLSDYLVLDLSQTKSFGAAFMGGLLLSRRELAVRDCSLLLSRLNPYCSEVLEVANLDDLFRSPEPL